MWGWSVRERDTRRRRANYDRQTDLSTQISRYIWGSFCAPSKDETKMGWDLGEWAGCGGLTIIGLSAYVCVCANLIGPINAIRGIIN